MGNINTIKTENDILSAYRNNEYLLFCAHCFSEPHTLLRARGRKHFCPVHGLTLCDIWLLKLRKIWLMHAVGNYSVPVQNPPLLYTEANSWALGMKLNSCFSGSGTSLPCPWSNTGKELSFSKSEHFSACVERACAALGSPPC